MSDVEQVGEEENFRLGVVTTVYEEGAQLLMLHSRVTSGAVEYFSDEEDFEEARFPWHRGAIDTDVPEVFEVIDVLEEIKTYDIEIPDMRTIATHMCFFRNDDLPEGISADMLKPGTIVHEHSFENDCTYCINPHTLSEQGLVAAVKHANQMRRDRIQGKIDYLLAEEPEYFNGLEASKMTDGLRLFEDASVVVTKRGSRAIVVPKRAIYSEKYGFQEIDVDTYPVHIDAPDDAGRFRYSAGGDIFWIPSIFLFEEVDERGVPVNLHRDRVRLEISVHNPLRQHSRAMEEEKLLFDLGNQTFWAEPSGEMLVGNQGFGGLDFMDFHDISQPDRYCEVRESPNNLVLPARYRSVDIIVAVDDVDLLREAIVRLPGFE